MRKLEEYGNIIDTIIVGYGSLNIVFKFPLPPDYIKKIYGTTSWTEYLEIIKSN